MDGWVNKSAKQSVTKLLNRHFHRWKTKSSRHLKSVNSMKKWEPRASHHRETLHWVNCLHWQLEWQTCLWTPFLLIINKGDFLMIGKVQNRINRIFLILQKSGRMLENSLFKKETQSRDDDLFSQWHWSGFVGMSYLAFPPLSLKCITWSFWNDHRPFSLDMHH